ncbi:beta-ketoacyl synthase N-terminal-like domain-containing protein [Chitinophaga sancti]|uniref:beta-ketoacyl synthase N-terminal-like domain-containing protein n=1 Tax=Chitinophaga sancti TaxID=1004 RepID=UPI002A761015|nr:beta-ketoacyl synthase N-terminal-like domain-containing protein [Chitinophaga sancti]WPQ61779.1 beta-ketoacyl synthase N-terminal-like domain-containing protein [Chitinophaga sancti]
MIAEKITLSLKNPMIANHRAYGQDLLPGLAYIDLIYQLFRKHQYHFNELELRNLSIHYPLTIEGDANVLLSIACTPAGSQQWNVKVEGLLQKKSGEQESKLYVTAEMHRIEPVVFEEKLDVAFMKKQAVEIVDLEEIYARSRSQELIHIGFMKADGNIYKAENYTCIDLSIPREAMPSGESFMFHPTLIDASGVGAADLMAVLVDNEQRLFLPLFYESFRASELFWKTCITRVQKSSIRRKNELLYMTMEFFDQAGNKVGELKNFTNKLVRGAGLINPDRKETRAAAAPRKTAAGHQGTSGAAGESGSYAESEAFIRGLMGARMKTDPEDIGIDIGYYEMGLDSPGLLEIVKAIETSKGIVLAPTLLFEYTTIKELAAYLVTSYPDKFGKDPAPVEQQTGAPKETASFYATKEALPQEEEIAVIGIGGRYPGADSIAEFWQNLLDGKDCITEVPKTRWNWENYEQISSPSGKKISKWGGFINHADSFDAPFFRISPREAEIMDPQERVFLEVCWESMEDAGYTPDTLVTPRGPDKRQAVGVFVGVMHKDYTLVAAEAVAKGLVFPLSLNYAPIANRVSYFCNFHGPSIAIDTVCSSSLTALHLALESIRRGESEVALAGGVNLSLHPNKYLTYGIADMHSSDGYCHTFGKGGDGYVSGEGVGAILLKPLSKALKDKDRVYAVIKGTAINHVGTVSGMMVPSPVAQADMISACMDKAGIHPRTISYVEAHGTGTSLGDPIEIQGLVKSYGQYTQDKEYCAIGSVKSNIGHAESAAGISGLSKVILQLYHKTLVPSLHSLEVNPYLQLSQTPFYIQHETEHWKCPVIEEEGQEKVYPRRAAVSSFGATGSNAHVILEEYVPAEDVYNVISVPHVGLRVIPLSAKSKTQLQEYAYKLLMFLKNADTAEETVQPQLEKAIGDTISTVLSTVMSVQKEAIEPDQEWNEYGIESIHLSRLKKELEDILRVNIDAVELGVGTSVSSLAAFLVKNEARKLAAFYAHGNAAVKADRKERVADTKISLDDVAYTLQVGRKVMEERAVFLAVDISDLISKLEAFLQEQTLVDGYYAGRIKKPKELSNYINPGDTAEKLVETLLGSGQLTRLAELWTLGFEVNWSSLYKDDYPGKISLPTYPFARERYWIPEQSPLEIAPVHTLLGGVVLHPLLHTNTSTFFEQRFTSRYTGTEFFLKDHQVHGVRILPGVAYLEMARVAVTEAMGAAVEAGSSCCLKNVVWIQPYAFNSDSLLHVSLLPGDDGEIAFEIYSEAAEGTRMVHSQGTAVWRQTMSPATIDLPSISAGCTKILSSAACYEMFREIGLAYGPGHQGIQDLYKGSDTVLARLELPVGDAGFVLHPGMMDAGFQAAIGMALGAGGESPAGMGAMLPFALDQLEVYKSCVSSMWAFVRYSDNGQGSSRMGKLDITLCDETGSVCVKLNGFSTRALGNTGTGVLMMEPQWRQQALASVVPTVAKRLVILVDNEDAVARQVSVLLGNVRCQHLQSGENQYREAVYCICAGDI